MATTHPKEERTLLLLKPDGVKRGLVGEVVRRVEQRGLKIVGLKMIRPTEAFIKEFLPGTESWKMGMGQKTLDTYSKYNRDPKRELGETDPLKIGEIIFGWLIKFWTSGPAVAIAVSGIHAIDMVRKIVGNTIPAKAEMGTIRGDYSVDSPVLANMEKRAIYNVVHASGDPAEAAHELKHWFKDSEIHGYERTEDSLYA